MGMRVSTMSQPHIKNCVKLQKIANGITDPIITIAEEGMEAFADAQGFYMVNEIPWLQYLPSWIPGMGFMRIAEEGYKKSMDMYKKPYQMFKKNLVRIQKYP